MRFGAYVTSTYGKRKTNAAEGLRAILQGNECLDALVAPEFTNITRETAEHLSKFDPDVLLVPGTVLRVLGENVYNRAYLVKNGKTFHAYDKKTFCGGENYTEADHLPGGVPRGVSIGHGQRSGVFTVSGKRFGIEICNDHTRGYSIGGHDHPVLAYDTRHETPRNFDYQIVPACGTQGINPAALVIKKEGACLLVDGDKHPFSRATGGDGNVIEPIKKIPVTAAGPNDYLAIYSL